MSASLVGSEMCIRDRCLTRNWPLSSNCSTHPCNRKWEAGRQGRQGGKEACLLYTSDAADDM
eukprot:3247170-Alexandrium_andersonii.AAC.1